MTVENGVRQKHSPDTEVGVARQTAIPRRRSRLTKFVRNRRVMIGVAVLGTIYLIALLAPLLAPFSPNEQILVNRLQGPSGDHPFGTDSLGRDILSRAIWAARISFVVSFVATLITVVIGTSLGLLSGFSGGIVDNIIMRFTDMILAFPIFILLITVVAIYGSGIGMLIIILGITAWPDTARLVRAEVLSLSTREFVLAARVTGATNLRIMLIHVLPNVVPIIVVAATLKIALIILIEAGLSYFGLGVPPPAPTWGNMVSDGRQYLGSAWWITAFPGMLIVITVLAYSLLGDGLRDAFDPRRRVG